MSKLLFDESPLVIQPSLAKTIGLNEAIVLQQIHYWLTRDKAGKEIDGVRWIYNSLSDWKEQFPFWSESTIYRALKSLEEMHLLKIGNFNQRKGDRTQWFTIAYDEVAFIESGGDRNSIFQDETAKSHNGTSSRQDETTLPETSPQISPEISPVVEPAPPPTDFEKVWKEVEQCFVMLSPSDFYKLRELWEQFPDFARHNYAIDRARRANPKQFRFYLKDFASFDPSAPRTWGQTLVPSNVPNAPPPLVPAVPMHPIALRAAAQNGENIRQTLERLLQTGTIKEEMYHATREKLLALLETPTRTVPLPTG